MAEYMERHDQQLPLNIRMLGDVATRCGSFSKALHYRELEYQALTGPRSSPRLVEALVSLHRSLGQPEAAIGVLTYAQQRQVFVVKLSWLEKLGRWQDALTSYEQRNCRSRALSSFSAACDASLPCLNGSSSRAFARLHSLPSPLRSSSSGATARSSTLALPTVGWPWVYYS